MKLYPLQTRNYLTIDPIIHEWATENSLQLYTELKDEEVRAVWFCDATGEVRFQIWIDPLDDDGTVNVNVWEVKQFIWERKLTKPKVFGTTAENLKQTLNDALSLVRSQLD